MAKSKTRKRVIVAGALGLLAAFGFAAVAKAGEPGDAREPHLDPLDPSPSDPDTRRMIDIAICECMDQGTSGELNLAKCAGILIWGRVPFPPMAGDHPDLDVAWKLITERVADFAKALAAGTSKEWCDEARGVDPGVVVPPIARPSKRPPTEPGGPIKPDPKGPWVPPPAPGKTVVIDPKPFLPDGPFPTEPKDPTWPSKPQPINPQIIVDYPRGGTIYQVILGDILLGQIPNKSIVYRWLTSDAYLAAKANGASDDEALAFAKSIGQNPNKRLQALNLILCSWWNDILYGTWGYGEQAWAGPHGRSIRLLPLHPRNVDAMLQGDSPTRNIQLMTPADKGSGDARGAWKELEETFEALWIPELDLDALWNTQAIEVNPDAWPDADPGEESRILPPPQVMNLGIYSAADVPSSMPFGCAGYPQWETS